MFCQKLSLLFLGPFHSIIYGVETQKVPLSSSRTSAAVEHKSGGKLGPTTNEGRTVTKSIPFLLQKSQAALSAETFDKGYQYFVVT